MGRGQRERSKTVYSGGAGNPLIISCALGWFLSISGVGLSGISKDVVDIAARAALPLGLLAVGGALRPEAVRGHLGPIVVSSIVQFGIKPLIAALMISLAGVTGVASGVLLIAMTTPTAPSAVILARQLGGDTEVMASIITIQTGMAFLLMPILGTQLPR